MPGHETLGGSLPHMSAIYACFRWKPGLWASTALLACLTASGTEAQQCKPKAAGYFTRLAAFTKATPPEMVGLTEPIESRMGNPGRGGQIAAEAQKGGCLACHRVPGLGGDADLGPNLAGAGQRYTEGQLRQIVVDPHKLFPDSVMPAYFKSADYARVPAELAGKTVLTAQDVEDVVAFLKNLK
jgi:sulfur-oxidizing protein SoxX